MGIINKEQFNETFQYFDNEIVVEIISIFLDEYSERIQKINDSIEADDAEKLKFEAHSIKGVVANFVAPIVEGQAKELEMMGIENRMEGARETFEAFKLSSAQLVDELREIKESYI